MTKLQHKKELADINRQIAALDIAREIAINKKRELEGFNPPATSSKFGNIDESVVVDLLIKSRKRRKINIESNNN